VDDWYLLMTLPRQEDRAKKHLNNLGFEVFYPRLLVNRPKLGVQQKVLSSLFPRYLFIKFGEENGHWSSIRSTRGVLKLIRFGDTPARVPPIVIANLKAQANEEDIIDQTIENPNIFVPGQQVEITDSSFKGLLAIVKEQDSVHRVNLLITMLGKEQTLSLPLSFVAAI
jgi:transcriptional antiterminator RfaH